MFTPTISARGRLVALFVSLAVLVACDDDEQEAGPIDGTWALSATECDGAAAQFPPFTLRIENTTGTFDLTFAPDCTASFEETYSYGEATIEITPASVSCEPAAGCAALGVDCDQPPPPVTYDFVLSGDTLTFLKTSVGPPADPCPAGEEVRFVMNR